MGPHVWRRDTWMRITPGLTLLALLAAPFIGGGGLGVASVLRQIALALLGGAYLATPALIGSHLIGLVGCALFLGVGLLAAFGGRYVTIDRATGELRVRHFYGLFTFATSHDLAGAVQVVQRCETNYELFKRHRPMSRPGRRGYTRLYQIELELRGGARVLLATAGSRERAAVVVAQVAELLGVPSSDLGLLGSPYRQTSQSYR